jgi:hypothetical protein
MMNWKYLGERCLDLIEFLHSPKGSEEIHKITVTISDFPAEIQTEYLLNKCVERYG